MQKKNEQIEQLIKTLRYCADHKACDGCEMAEHGAATPMCLEQIIRKAALIIDALAEERDLLAQKLAETGNQTDHLVSDDDLLRALQCCCPTPVYDEPHCDDCPMGRDCGPSGETWCSVALIGKARREIEKLRKSAPRWIFPKDRLPKEHDVNVSDDPKHPIIWSFSDWVLVWPKSLWAAGIYATSRARRFNGQWEFEFGFVKDDVMCWMEMPAQPKMEDIIHGN